VVEAKDVDAICIGTWPYMHAEMTAAALAAGKHVLCEARMAMNATEGRRMLEAARRTPQLVAQLVPAPHTLEVDRKLKQLIADGYAGALHAVEVQGTQQARFAEQGDALHWRQNINLSGNNILNMGIWYEAMMRWLGPAGRVMAMTKIATPKRKDESGQWHEVKVPDHVDILVNFKSGPVGHLRFSSLTALAPPPEAWIFGSEGTLRVEVDAKRLSGGRRGDKELKEIAIPAEQRIGWRVEEEFVNAIHGRETITHTSFEDGVRYMEFTDAVARSAASGQAVDVKDL
jgi:predicted dehydrogenase